MKNDEYLLTPQGKQKLELELKKLREERPHAVEALNHARSMGDLRENSAYTATKAKLSDIDHRIVKLELMLRKSIVVEKTDDGKVGAGNTVTLGAKEGRITVTIVGDSEADPKTRKISMKSPLAQAIAGKKVGDIAKFESPNGIIEYTVMQIK